MAKYQCSIRCCARSIDIVWLPLPILFIGIVVLWFGDIQTPYERIGLLNTLNLLLITLPALGVAFLFAQSFLMTGSVGVGLFGCGALFLSSSGLGPMEAAVLSDTVFTVNALVIIHNLNVWAACLCFLAGAALLFRGRFVVSATAPALLAAFVLTLLVAAYITFMAIQQWSPLFFVQGQGATPQRQLVLASAISETLLTFLLLWKRMSFQSAFGRWFAPALLLIAIACIGIALQTTFGGVLGWLSRAAYYLSGAYLLMAARAASHDAEAPFVSHTPPSEIAAHPYAVAVAIVLIAAVLRAVFLSALQSPFITFYPAVILAALYGGLRAGALGALLAAVLVHFPWMAQAETPLLVWPRSWLTIVIFTINSLLIALVVELMENARRRLRRVEAERRAELEQLVAELRNARNSAELASAELKTVFDTAPVGIWIARDPSCQNIQGNRLGSAWLPIEPIPAIANFSKAAADRVPFTFFDKAGQLIPLDHLPLHRAGRGEEVTDYEVECRLKHGECRTLLGNAAPLRDAEGQVFGAVGTFIDISERKRAEKALRESEDRLRAALKAGKLGVFDYDPRTGRWAWSGETYRLLGIPEGEVVTQERWEAAIHHEDLDAARDAFKSILDPVGARHVQCEFRILDRAKGSVRWLFADGEAIFDGERPIRVVGTMQNITERKRAQEQIDLLLREVNHRSKNMLGLIQAIAHQTIASTPQEFLERFTDRMRALAASQDLLVKNVWKGVALVDLVRSHLALFEDHIGARVVLEGPALRITASAAQTLGMALHELATNAGKYGAFSNNEGRIEIKWMLEHTGDAEDIFHLHWSESGGPPVEEPKRSGFGTVLIAQAPRMNLDAVVQLNYDVAGLNWQLKCPAVHVLEKMNDAGNN